MDVASLGLGGPSCPSAIVGAMIFGRMPPGLVSSLSVLESSCGNHVVLNAWKRKHWFSDSQPHLTFLMRAELFEQLSLSLSLKYVVALLQVQVLFMLSQTQL